MVGRIASRWMMVAALILPVSAAAAPKTKAKAKGKGMEAEFARIDANGNVTIDKGRVAGVVKGCAVSARAHVREVAADKGTAVIYLAKPVAEIKKGRTLDLVCGKAKVKATITGVASDREKGARVALVGLKGKTKVDKECAHTFLVGRVERVYEHASVVPSALGDIIATQKTFWVECL